MRRVAIVEPVRSAVGAFGKTLRPLPAVDLAAKVLTALIDRTAIDPAVIEKWCSPSPTPTPRRRASAGGRRWRRPADRGSRIADRPALRRWSTGGGDRGHDGADRCRRRRRRRWCRIDEQHRALHHNGAVGLTVG